MPALHAESAGNPFYLRQLALFRGPTDAVDAADQPPDAILPAAVSNALRAELALIDAATRGALEGAAVAGDPFVLDLAAVAAAVPEQAMSRGARRVAAPRCRPADDYPSAVPVPASTAAARDL